jgi:hypothetical protein
MIKRGGIGIGGHSSRGNVYLFFNGLPGMDILNVEDLTTTEVTIRKRMLITLDYYKKHMPGFENCFILDTASQTGTRGSRRLIGEYMVTGEDVESGKTYEDTIAVIPQHHHRLSPEHPHVHIPYRSLVPVKVDNLLVAGRSFSSDDVANNDYNLIPHCILFGQAAGTAAALAIKSGVKVRNVDYKVLQKNLVKQNVVLPNE